MNNNLCLVEKCGNYIFKDKKCILHCNKFYWYKDINGRRNWFKNEIYVKNFWLAIKELNSDRYDDIVFPKFLEDKYLLNNFITSEKYTIFNSDRLAFFNCTFEDDVILENTLFKSPVSFINCVFKKKIVLTNSIFADIIDFSESTFEGEVLLKNSYILNSIYLNKVTIKDKFLFVGKELQLKNYKNILFYYLKRLAENGVIKNNNLIENKSLIKKLLGFINKLIKKDIRDKKSYSLRHLHLVDAILDKDAIVEFRGTYLESKKNNYIANNIKLSTIEILNFINYSKSFKLNNIEIDITFNIINSNLGIAEFNNIDLSKSILLSRNKKKKEDYYKIKFQDSSLVDTKLNNIKWGKEENLTGDREDFRQLKNILDNQKNYIDANKMHKRELYYYQKEIKYRIELKKQATNFLLFLSKIISLHGTCWVLPIFWFFSISLIFFFLFYDSAYPYQVEINSFNDFLNYFARYTNPLHYKVFERFTNEYWWWLIHKIFSIFIIYHLTISLKRKIKR